MNKQRDKLSEGQRAEIPDLYSKGVSVAEMMRMFQVSDAAIRYWIPNMKTSGRGQLKKPTPKPITYERRFDSSEIDSSTRKFFMDAAEEMWRKDALHLLHKTYGLKRSDAKRIYEDWRHDYVRGILKW